MNQLNCRRTSKNRLRLKRKALILKAPDSTEFKLTVSLDPAFRI
jgi:hypothetical protein